MVLAEQDNFEDAEKAALAVAVIKDNAPRPLPDFPAKFPECAPGPWRKGNHANLLDASGGFLFSIPRHPNSADGLIIRNFILSRVNAPARPAAAGLTEAGELSQLELDRVVSAAAIPAPSYAPDRIVYVDDVRRAISEYRKILSSRATGVTIEGEGLEYLASVAHKAYLDACSRLGWEVKPENRVCYDLLSENAKELDREMVLQVLAARRATGAEVEIVIPEPIDDEITAFAMSSETGYGNMSHWFNHRWFRAGIEYARRHATIREKK